MFNWWKITWTSTWFTIFTWKNEYWKVEKLVASLYDKIQYVIHIGNLKQALNHGYNYRFKKNSKKWFWKRLFRVNGNIGTLNL